MDTGGPRRLIRGPAGRHWRGLWLALGLAVGGPAVGGPAVGTPATANAAALWALVGTPLTATTGERTDIKLTATNESLLDNIGCIRIETTTHFDVERADANHGWSTGVNGTVITASSPSLGSRLGLLETLDITIRATPLDPGTWSWTGTAYADLACGGSPLLGVPIVAIVVTGPAPTPVPTATPTPAPVPAPTLTPAPKPGPTSPLAVTPRPTGTPRPSAVSTAGPSPSPPSVATRASEGPRPTDGAAPTISSSATKTPVLGEARDAPGSGDAPLPGDAFAVRAAGMQIDAGLGGLAEAGPVLLQVAVPGAVVALPGLLFLLAIAAQAMGGLAWVPVVRRHLGSGRKRRRTRFIRRSL